MNNDYLRVNSKDEEEGICTDTFEAKEEPVVEEKQNKPTLFSVLGIHRKGGMLSENMKVPDIRDAFPVLLIAVFLNLFLFFVAQMTMNTMLLLIMALTSSLILPLFTVYFVYGLNVMKNVSYVYIFGGFAIGLILYVLLVVVKDHSSELLFNEKWILWMFNHLLDDVALFFVAMLYVKFSKKDNIFAIVLLVTTVYGGFGAAKSMAGQIEQLMTVVTFGGSGSNSQPTSAILFSDYYFRKYSAGFFSSVAYYSVFLSFMSFFQSIICGGIVALTASPVRADRGKESSVYLLLLLCCCMNLMVSFDSTIVFFGTILKVVAFLVCAIVFLKMFNYLLSRANFSEP